ncbi:MAG TPA: hypothetical protein VLR88_08770 [Propionibacteriaceae bacterium]|nr:hypothetical protein [Propionibacteriaceae bacterium]
MRRRLVAVVAALVLLTACNPKSALEGLSNDPSTWASHAFRTLQGAAGSDEVYGFVLDESGPVWMASMKVRKDGEMVAWHLDKGGKPSITTWGGDGTRPIQGEVDAGAILDRVTTELGVDNLCPAGLAFEIGGTPSGLTMQNAGCGHYFTVLRVWEFAEIGDRRLFYGPAQDAASLDAVLGDVATYLGDASGVLSVTWTPGTGAVDVIAAEETPEGYPILLRNQPDLDHGKWVLDVGPGRATTTAPFPVTEVTGNGLAAGREVAAAGGEVTTAVIAVSDGVPTVTYLPSGLVTDLAGEPLR